MSNSRRGSQKARDTLEYLRARITSGDWPIDAPIPKEPELMELIGVGKSTVREAVRTLANLGMLETVPGTGTFVRARTPVTSILTQFLADHDLEEVLVYRRSLEIEAAQHAAIHRTDEHVARLRAAYERACDPRTALTEACHASTTRGSFHHIIVEASGSALLLDLYMGVMTVLQNASNTGLVILGTTHETMQLDHRAVLQAIEDRDVRNAAHSMALHVDRDLGLGADTLDFGFQTERATSLIDAGYEPRPE